MTLIEILQMLDLAGIKRVAFSPGMMERQPCGAWLIRRENAHAVETETKGGTSGAYGQGEAHQR